MRVWKLMPANVPINWIEDEDGEIVPAAHTVDAMQPYRAYPSLYSERLLVPRLIGTVFNFLALPAEIRILIYRQALRCYYPIKPRESDLRIDKRDCVEVNLLRTCHQVNREGSEVFFGENQFELWHGSIAMFVHDLLPYKNVDWLQSLAIELPFYQATLTFKMSELEPTYPPMRRVVGAESYRTDFVGTRMVQYHLDAICSASRLRRLTLVIHPHWPFFEKGEYRGPNWDNLDDFEAVVTNSDVWDDLAVLLNHRRDLKVTVVRLHFEGQSSLNEIQHHRMVTQLRHRLGIWDVRETALILDKSRGIENWT